MLITNNWAHRRYIEDVSDFRYVHEMSPNITSESFVHC